jgi:hypothetical protein
MICFFLVAHGGMPWGAEIGGLDFGSEDFSNSQMRQPSSQVKLNVSLVEKGFLRYPSRPIQN